MDDQAFQFLCTASPSAQQMVVDSFAPNKQDSDYSALIINYTRRCKETFNPAKRQRMF